MKTRCRRYGRSCSGHSSRTPMHKGRPGDRGQARPDLQKAPFRSGLAMDDHSRAVRAFMRGAHKSYQKIASNPAMRPLHLYGRRRFLVSPFIAVEKDPDMNKLAATALSMTLAASVPALGEDDKQRFASAPVSMEDVQAVSPALAKYTPGHSAR
ncbi:hypothetical protein RGR602_PC00145 (plasmid) [Rhizobium gallicum bv. gallicum R602sp]|uniref:Uncharacterized protein n=1 Tax=Rhizobium gallicum bv. gallicum R602sp TaxID=1041138 RepID=A0A0B4XCF2_9HYPH|nr:hypothetical protein RGR602_PC00145 [Rhizobium gallicum bv. gallicum R602sp]